MKRLVLFATLALAFCLYGTAALAVDLSALPPELRDRVEDLLATRYPPELKSISISPEAPAADEAVTVTAQIFNDSKVTDDETSEVYLQYSVDGGETWEEVEMESDDSKNWTGEIPGQAAGTEVLYGLRAIDSSGNYYVDLTCKVPGFPPEGYMDKTCVNGDDLSACNALPIGCMFGTARDEDPVDDEDTLYPDAADYIDTRVGFDDDNIYFDFGLQGEATEGKMSPMDVRGYGVAFIPADVKSGDLDTLMKEGAIIVSAPLAGKVAAGLVKGCFMGYAKGSDFFQDDKATKCDMDGKHLSFILKRASLPKKSDKIVFAGVGLGITSITPISGSAYDNTRWTTINLEPRSYTVE